MHLLMSVLLVIVTTILRRWTSVHCSQLLVPRLAGSSLMPSHKRLRQSPPAPTRTGAQAQRRHDVVAHARRRSCGERKEGHACERLPQLAQAPVLQPEVVAPCTPWQTGCKQKQRACAWRR